MSNNVSDEKNGVPFEEIQKQFFQCVRGPNETFDEFLAKLHALAELGRFGEKTNTVILNKIKTEMADVDLKQKLESITDYDKAVDKCREAEEWRNASMDPYIVRLRQEIKSHGISKLQTQEDFAHFFKMMTNIRAKKWTRHTTILYFIQKLLLQIDAKMEEVVTGDGVIWPIGTLVLTCSHCDELFDHNNLCDLSDEDFVIPERDLATIQLTFEEIIMKLPKALGFLALLKSKLHGAVIQLALTCEHHNEHFDKVDFAIVEKFYCGICVEYKATFGHFKSHWQLLNGEARSEQKKNSGYLNKNRNRRGGRNNAKPQGELQEVLEAGTSRDKQHNGFKRDNKRGNKNYRSDRQNYMGNRFLIDHKDLLSEPDATIKIQADRFSGIKADEMDKVKEDLMETFEDSVFEFYGSREYGLGFRIDIMVKPSGKDVIDLNAYSVDRLRCLLARKSDLWKLGKAGKTITFEHLKTRSGCKIFLGKPDDIFIHNTKMIDYLLNLQPEMRKFAIFICKWFKRARVLFSLKTYSLVLMIITYAQKHKFMPSMVQLKQKCLEMTKDKESYASDAEWLNEFKHDVLLKDLELEEMTDYKSHIQAFFQFFMDNPIEDFAFLPYSGDVVKKSELVNYKVGEEAIFTDYELNGLFIGGLLDFTNNTTHDLWLKDNEKIAKLVEWSVKSLNDLNMSEEPQIEKKEEVQEEFIEVKETSAEEGVENEGENPAKKSEGESNKNPIKDSLEVVPLDEIISATETEAETNSSSISRSASTASDLSEHSIVDFDSIMEDLQKKMTDPTLVPAVVVTPPRDPPME